MISSMDDCRSDMRLSKPDVSAGALPDLDPSDLAGLVLELGWLGRSDRLDPDWLDDTEADGLW